MDKDVLVSTDFATGGKLVEALDNSTLPISVALWLRLPEYGDWRFALASRRLDSAQPAEAYGLVHDALGAAGLTLENTPPLQIFNTAEPFIKDLRRLFGKSKSAEGMRLGGQLIGGRFVEDALVYRVK